MTAKRWLYMFLSSLVIIAAMWAGLNVLVDPFGVFGDVIFDWASYSMTQNPRVGKIEYLDDHFEEYDSYIIGCSSTSSFPVDTLNDYYGANFYNLIMYGADMLDVEETVNYITQNYRVKNLVLNVYIDNAAHYNVGEDLRQNRMHPRVTGRNGAEFYLDLLFLDPTYALNKVRDWYNDTELSQSFDVFDVTTGAYDKRARDSEPIRDLDSYLDAYPVFSDYPEHWSKLTAIDETVDSVARIRDVCVENGINFTVVTAPVYADYMEQFDQNEVAEFYERLAEVTDFWDFAVSSVSCDPRYFYDATHFRNSVGDMALARVFGDDSVYVPENFGTLVTAENARETVDGFCEYYGAATDTHTANVPVLMYHDIAAEGTNSMTISEKTFREHMKALYDAGYNTVTVEELVEFVEQGRPLPEKPVVITFDDGYMSNYDIAYPILREYGFEANIFVIGVSVGKDTYKDTENAITPHFGEAEMAEMTSSGLITIGSHTYDMHQWAPYESGTVRESVSRLPGESEEEFISALRKDFSKSSSDIETATGEAVTAFAYPMGVYDTLSQWVLSDLGVKVTFSTDHGTNTVIKGLPQSLSALRRYNISDDYTADELLELVGG